MRTHSRPHAEPHLGVPPPPDAAEQLAQRGENLLRRAQYGDAAAAFEQAEKLSPRAFRQFVNLASCHLSLSRPDEARAVCERGLAITSNDSDLHRLRGDALSLLNRQAEAREAYAKAMVSSDYAYTAAEQLLLPLATEPGGSRLLAACDAMPPAYANCTVVRGFRAIALSRIGRVAEAKKLVDLDLHVGRFVFKPPSEFGGIARFNQLLADEILHNPGLCYVKSYGFHRTEYLDIKGARAFPALATFLRGAIENFVAEFPQRGLDAILPPPPHGGYLKTAGNVMRDRERHTSHLHKFAYVSGVYHVIVPPIPDDGDDRAGALVIGACDDFTGGYAPCWGYRDIRPVAGVATLFPSHFFHSVVPTRRQELRIAVPFDLGVIASRPVASQSPANH